MPVFILMISIWMKEIYVNSSKSVSGISRRYMPWRYWKRQRVASFKVYRHYVGTEPDQVCCRIMDGRSSLFRSPNNIDRSHEKKVDRFTCSVKGINKLNAIRIIVHNKQVIPISIRLEADNVFLIILLYQHALLTFPVVVFPPVIRLNNYSTFLTKMQILMPCLF